MKKRLVAFMIVSALAVTSLAGCGGKGDAAGDAADAAATGEAAVVAATETVEDSSAALSAAIEEAAATADTGAAVAAEAGDTAAEAAVEYVDDEEIKAEAGDTAAEAAAEETEDLVVEPGTYYTVRFGGEVFGAPDETTAAIDYVYPDWTLLINERLDNYWYAITYIVDGVSRSGYIKIQ